MLNEWSGHGNGPDENEHKYLYKKIWARVKERKLSEIAHCQRYQLPPNMQSVAIPFAVIRRVHSFTTAAHALFNAELFAIQTLWTTRRIFFSGRNYFQNGDMTVEPIPFCCAKPKNVKAQSVAWTVTCPHRNVFVFLCIKLFAQAYCPTSWSFPTHVLRAREEAHDNFCFVFCFSLEFICFRHLFHYAIKMKILYAHSTI